MDDELRAILSSWTSMTHVAVLEYATAMQPFFGRLLELDLDNANVFGSLSLSCLSTTQSALILVGYNRVWDAEMQVRSVLEGTIKFVFLCHPDAATRKSRCDEYFKRLTEIASLKRDDRLEKLLAIVQDPDAAEWKPLRDLRLRPDEAAALRNAYPSKVRRELESKWSVPSLIVKLAEDDPSYNVLVGLLHGYGTSSHLVHQDGDGVAIVRERAARSAERIEAIELAHGARELEDLLMFTQMRTTAAFRMIGLAPQSLVDLNNTHAPLMSQLRGAVARWHKVEYGG